MNDHTRRPVGDPTRTRYVIIYRNPDGTFSPGPYAHRMPICPVAAIPDGENRPVVGVFPVSGNFDPAAELLTAQDFKAVYAVEVAALHRELAEASGNA